MQGFLGFVVNEVLSQPAVIAGLMALDRFGGAQENRLAPC